MNTIRLPKFKKVIWLMPIAYGLHIVEEYTANFPAWVSDDVHTHFSYLGFDLNNIMFMIILLVLVYLNYRKPTKLHTTALVVFASANLFWDALFHLFTTVLLNRYSPGLATAFLLYYPICLLLGLIIVKENRLSRVHFLSALAGGLIIFGFVVWYGLFHFAT